MLFLLMYILDFSESASKKFARPPKSGQNPIGEIAVCPLRVLFEFWPDFGGPANFFEALSENFRIYISKNTIGFLINQLSELS